MNMNLYPDGASPGVFHSLKFEKTGAEIQRGIDTRISTLNESIQASQARIVEICKRREIDAADLLKDDDQETTANKVSTYTSSLAESLQAKSALEKLNADMQQLRSETWGIQGAKSQISALATVKKNIQTERKFDLTYSELTTLGF